MMRYFYAFAPLVVSGTVVMLALPWLGLIALFVFVSFGLVAVAALAWAIVFLPYALVRTIGLRVHSRVGTPQSATAQALIDRRHA